MEMPKVPDPTAENLMPHLGRLASTTPGRPGTGSSHYADATPRWMRPGRASWLVSTSPTVTLPTYELLCLQRSSDEAC
jgi:hypothetical protein